MYRSTPRLDRCSVANNKMIISDSSLSSSYRSYLSTLSVVTSTALRTIARYSLLWVVYHCLWPICGHPCNPLVFLFDLVTTSILPSSRFHPTPLFPRYTLDEGCVSPPPLLFTSQNEFPDETVLRSSSEAIFFFDTSHFFLRFSPFPRPFHPVTLWTRGVCRTSDTDSRRSSPFRSSDCECLIESPISV
jgi:hypothetical protein